MDYCDWDDEYDPDEYEVSPDPQPESVARRFSCLRCKGGLIVATMPGMTVGTACPCGQAFMFDDAGEDYSWHMPKPLGYVGLVDGPIDQNCRVYDPDTKPAPNHVRDAIEANR